jgi:hypothetical protein
MISVQHLRIGFALIFRARLLDLRNSSIVVPALLLKGFGQARNRCGRLAQRSFHDRAQEDGTRHSGVAVLQQ